MHSFGWPPDFGAAVVDGVGARGDFEVGGDLGAGQAEFAAVRLNHQVPGLRPELKMRVAKDLSVEHHSGTDAGTDG